MSSFIHHPPARLVLSNGTVLHGFSLGVQGTCCAELVFNTGMSGYQETLSDPSYAMQFIVFTAPHVGINGCNKEDNEAEVVQSKGCILLNPPTPGQHYRNQQSFEAYLIHNQLMSIYGIDTRMLTQLLRDQGQMNACISTDASLSDEALHQLCRQHKSYDNIPLGEQVATEKPYQFKQASWHKQYNQIYQSWLTKKGKPTPKHIVVFDLGCKQEIMRRLCDQGAKVTVIPPTTPLEQIQALNADGYLLSNGPGDPECCQQTIATTKALLQQDKPVLGICLGMQILALAAGASTEKMRLGHHGINHPVINLETNELLISSQNHNYVVNEASLPPAFKVTHRSLFDQSIQGIAHQDKPIFGFQGHPEGGPGPLDPCVLFDYLFNPECANA
jgi:carbamoyl-phosphate synthase small subunit